VIGRRTPSRDRLAAADLLGRAADVSGFGASEPGVLLGVGGPGDLSVTAAWVEPLGLPWSLMNQRPGPLGVHRRPQHPQRLLPCHGPRRGTARPARPPTGVVPIPHIGSTTSSPGWL
jgi:hypothetical protein